MSDPADPPMIAYAAPGLPRRPPFDWAGTARQVAFAVGTGFLVGGVLRGGGPRFEPRPVAGAARLRCRTGRGHAPLARPRRPSAAAEGVDVRPPRLHRNNAAEWAMVAALAPLAWAVRLWARPPRRTGTP